MESPCKTCTRVKDPEKCVAKTCPVWKEWWLERWKAINNFGRRYAKKRRTEDGNAT